MKIWVFLVMHIFTMLKMYIIYFMLADYVILSQETVIKKHFIQFDLDKN